VISLIDQENDQYPVHTLCEVLEVPRSTYYQSLTKTVSNRDKENQQLTNRILEIYHESKRRYGAPKIHYLLNQEGYNVSLKRDRKSTRLNSSHVSISYAVFCLKKNISNAIYD